MISICDSIVALTNFYSTLPILRYCTIYDSIAPTVISEYITHYLMYYDPSVSVLNTLCWLVFDNLLYVEELGIRFPCYRN